MKNRNPGYQGGDSIEIVAFSNRSKRDRKFLKKFVDFHWEHYRDDPQYVPLLDYEYLGSRIFGIKGFFEPDNGFFKHAEIRFYMALQHKKTVGRCVAFVNHDHNERWMDKVGFFGHFEAMEDLDVAHALLKSAGSWLTSKGMEVIRGPHNLPVNEVTPGFLTDGFDTRPVIYYHYNKPYYAKLIKKLGFRPVKRVFSWEYPALKPLDEKIVRAAERIVERYHIKIETWGQRPLKERGREMLEIYNEAWNDNWGFVPFRKGEFYQIIQDMQLIMDKNLFIFLYIDNEPVAFFGGIPNLSEGLVPIKGLRRLEWIRAAKMLMSKGRIKGFRLGYLGVKKKFRRLGLDGVMLWHQEAYNRQRRYEYTDVGWVLEDNKMTIRLIEKAMGARLSKTYTIFEKLIE